MYENIYEYNPVHTLQNPKIVYCRYIYFILGCTTQQRGK